MPEKSFEDFISQHRPDFEEQGPGPDVWKQLEKELAPPKRGLVQMKKAQHLENVSPELQDAKMYYTSQIEQRLTAIKAYPSSVVGLDSSARKELELRNETYQVLEAELLQNPGNERIKAAMIHYYQLKMDLLDKILDELREKQPAKQNQPNYEREI
jgi:hypothetical protein